MIKWSLSINREYHWPQYASTGRGKQPGKKKINTKKEKERKFKKKLKRIYRNAVSHYELLCHKLYREITSMNSLFLYQYLQHIVSIDVIGSIRIT